MADVAKKATRSRARGKSGRAVGKAGPSWRPAFYIALAAAGASLVVLVLVLVAKFDGGPDGAGGAAPAATETPDAGPTAIGTHQAATGSAATPTAVSTPYAELLPCGNPLVPIDKQHRLPADCEPSDLVELPASMTDGSAQYLRRETLTAMKELLDAAGHDGYRLFVNSAYRSYATQDQTFAQWVQIYGLQYAERTSARAGQSEHQLGTTADVGYPGHYLEGFTGTEAASWLAANSWKHGFILSYPDGKEDVTGYAYEPWHIRYVGVELAKKVHDSGLTLHEYLLRH